MDILLDCGNLRCEDSHSLSLKEIQHPNEQVRAAMLPPCGKYA